MTKHVSPVSGGFFSSMLSQHLLDLLAWYGLPSAELLARAGMTLEEMNSYGYWVPAAVGQKVLHAALDMSQDPRLFLKLSKNTFPTGYGMVGQVMQVCPTLNDVIQALTRYEGLISDFAVTRMQHQPGKTLWGIECHLDDPEMVRQIVEFTLACRYYFLYMVREKRSNIVVATHFEHAAPKDENALKAYADIFHCPLYFSQPETALVLKAEALKLPMRQADSSLKDVLEVQAQKKLVEQQTPPSFLERARAQLLVLLQNGTPSRDLLASHLGISARHLYRQLQSSGSSYRELLDTLRLHIAQRHLRESTMKIEEIGRLLCFSDSQTFIRWFRQMTEHTPGEYRVQAQGNPASVA